MTEEEKTEPAEAVVEETTVVDETTAVAEPVPATEEIAGNDEEVATADEPAADSVPKMEPLKLDGVKQKGPHVPLPSSLQEIVGALLFASESPLTAGELRTSIRGVAPEEGDDAEVMSVYQSCTSREIEQALHGLEKELERSGCGFRLVCTGGSYRLQTAPACGRYVRAMLKLDKPSRLSRASLETLAIIAYRQPITKAEIEQIRGVAVDTIVKSLVELQLVRLVGRSELPGHPFLYGTSPVFLEHFGLSSLSELNEIDPTLQRSNPRERAKMFVKEKKADEKPVEEKNPTEEKPVETTAAESVASEQVVEGTDSVETPATETNETAGVADEKSTRVSFRPDDDDTDDEPLTDDDEPLTDDDDDDDEPLTDNDDDDDDDEPLTDDDDDDDDEPLTDDEEEEEDEFDDDEDDEEGEEDEEDE